MKKNKNLGSNLEIQLSKRINLYLSENPESNEFEVINHLYINYDEYKRKNKSMLEKLISKGKCNDPIKKSLKKKKRYLMKKKNKTITNN